jgi:hypothetical protein
MESGLASDMATDGSALHSELLDSRLELLGRQIRKL